MHTIQLDIADDKLDTFLTIVDNLKNDIVQNIRLQNNLDIEPIEKESADFLDIQKIKSENNPKYSITEAEARLGLWLTVIIDDNAIKNLSKLDKTEAKKILNKISELEKYPHIPNIKKLTNFEPPYRLRVGNYRVLFDIEDTTITIYKIKHRKEVYK